MRVLRVGPLEHGDRDAGAAEPVEALVEVVDPESPHRVLLRLVAAAAGGWHLTSVDVARPPLGPPLDTEALRRLPLDRYLVLATNHLRTSEPPAGEGPGGTPRTVPPGGDDETLQTVADTYRETPTSPVPRERVAPTAAVARALGIRRHEAARLVASARRRGLLNPARPRQAGEFPTGTPDDGPEVPPPGRP